MMSGLKLLISKVLKVRLDDPLAWKLVSVNLVKHALFAVLR